MSEASLTYALVILAATMGWIWIGAHARAVVKTTKHYRAEARTRKQWELAARP